MTPDVAWPKAFEGCPVLGLEAIRSYWTEPWRKIDPPVEPAAFQPQCANRIVVDVPQVARDLSGTVVADGHVDHRFTAAHGLIKAMRVCHLSAPGA